jgi:hypothetical protein
MEKTNLLIRIQLEESSLIRNEILDLDRGDDTIDLDWIENLPIIIGSISLEEFSIFEKKLKKISETESFFMDVGVDSNDKEFERVWNFREYFNKGTISKQYLLKLFSASYLTKI